MILYTLATDRGPRACVGAGHRLIDLNDADPSLPTSLRQILEGGPEALARAAAVASAGVFDAYPSDTPFLAPIPDPRKVVCIGLNYRDHAEETGAKIPEEPILFSKYPSAVIGHDAPIVLPAVSQEVDYEAELVVVIGRVGRHIPVERAFEYVFGYTVGHDVSARDWQLRKPGGQWMAGKTFDTFAPIGPGIVTADQVPDPRNLGIRLRLNGRTMQDSNTNQLIFGVAEIVSYLSKIFTLEPGDLIFTGTPPGVGMARKPPVWLKAGDVVEVEIDGIGTLRNPVVAG